MLETIKDRQSARKYLSTEVEDEKLVSLIESARLAPSGSNTQPWNFIIIKSKETQQKIMNNIHYQKWMETAPVFIVAVADIRCRIKEGEIFLDEESSQFELKQIIRDTSIAISHILLEAEHQGLGACWTCWFNQDEVRPLLGIPTEKFVVGIITVGYAADKKRVKRRRSIEEMIRYEKW